MGRFGVRLLVPGALLDLLHVWRDPELPVQAQHIHTGPILYDLAVFEPVLFRSSFITQTDFNFLDTSV